MDPSVLNVVLYLYEHYLEDDAERPPRAALENILQSGGVSPAKASQALDWLDAFASERPAPAAPRNGAQRIYGSYERSRLSTAALGLVMQLEQEGILDASERELVLERALALDEAVVELEAMQWVVLLTLYHQPGRENAFARMEDLCYPVSDAITH